MNLKVNDIVIPKHMIGRVVNVKKDKVVFERTDMNGKVRTFELNEKHAKTRGISLEKLILDNLIVVDKEALRK